MKKAPKAGQRVRYFTHPAWSEPRECLGVVEQVHPCGVWVADGEYEGEETGYRDESRLAPETEWQVTLKADKPLPSWWPYPGTDLFCPSVVDLNRVAP